ncbi:ExbD/TolR family protein [Penaeicola halotolerans]|uniref:ExbD/TolR family protein n=1 Tax=Penaeicola halotolerans TaxID=2793196 RepID=UPI001CF89C6F|nr:biopolymer transporter ExbD [Penaeicola halotolerans]
MAKGKNRMSAEVNAGSMADIAFLLLIFFLVTTTIASDKGITMLLPPKPDENTPPPEVDKNARNIFKVQINSADQLLVEDEPLEDVEEISVMAKEFILNFGRPDEANQALFNSLPASLRAQALRADNSSDHPGEAVVSFKTDRGTSYELYLQVLDEIKKAYFEIYGERVGLSADEYRALSTRNPGERELIDRGKENIPMNISIAEPSKAGGN